MDIKKSEFKKIITSSVIIFLFVIFNLFNLFIIYENLDLKDDFKVTQDIVKRYGYKIDDNMVKNFKKYYNDEIKKMNEITEKSTGKKYKSALELANDLKGGGYSYTKENIDFFNKVSTEEYYYESMKNVDNEYNKMNVMDIAEMEIKKYKLQDKAAETVRGEYRDFNKRFKEIVQNKEYKNIFFIGKHSLLFNTLFKSFIYEIMILWVLIMGYLINYEFDNNTYLLTYSTKRGRRLVWDKLQVAIFTNLILSTAIIGFGLLAYFIAFDYSGLWHVPISNYFNREQGFTSMCWYNLSFIQYMVATIFIIYMCNLLFNGIAFFISMYVKNSYIVFFIFVVFFGISILGIPGISLDSNMIFILGFNPFMLVMNTKAWLMEAGAFFTFKYYELITIGVWGGILIVLSILSFNRFKKRDIN
ncbi:hypothetical protein ADU80_09515 [Clostridium botulinum]|uniref:Uncharacterized protein n=1 Tax=Clostridium botulinum TaxID=1491 RepID=A0A9Q1ZAQ6_CLOBO|nr:hypothetical protein [Clostridium botulinum]AEB74977.1 putative membrane protein [Clostridium botulinum BKT015925]KEI02252.1 hypothetical protein Y848_07885 [Clostridium botulinum C/D str. Sp77]KEI03637.1 hypothetical protein Z953_04035 [Clostridium botulinum D str. 16868]KOA78875.1 hypothetical protein ADU77_05170 [Clostridium botulinum]KOA81763.1 hypothetical protein ADU74_14030 [Clostridium botulinum]